MMTVQLVIPEAMAPFINHSDDELGDVRNAMILYPYIRRGEMSHGYAANIIGISKRELIELYGSLGLPYFNQSEDEVLTDIGILKTAREAKIC